MGSGENYGNILICGKCCLGTSLIITKWDWIFFFPKTGKWLTLIFITDKKVILTHHLNYE